MEAWDHNIVVFNEKHKSDQVENLQIWKRGNTLCHNFYSSHFLNKLTVRNNPKERQCQRMLKLPHNCTHLTCYYSKDQNSPSQASAIHESWTSRCSSWFYKRQGNQRSNCQHLLDHQKSKRVPEKNIYFCFIDYDKALDCVDHNKLWKTLKEMGISDHLTGLLRNLYAGQEATVRTGHGKTDLF